MRDLATEEARRSGLPGEWDGPQDALRHIIGAAELRRRFGLGLAWSAVDANEWWGSVTRRQPRAARDMDDRNNVVGLDIGARARTYEEVAMFSREAIRRGIERGGTGEANTPFWRRPRILWTSGNRGRG